MRQSEEIFSYVVMSMNWRYCLVLELSGAGTNHDGHGFYGLVAINVFPDRLRDLHAGIMVYCYKAILHPGLVECLYGGIFAGRRIRCTWFNNQLCRLS
jgi:hypothetical protein